MSYAIIRTGGKQYRVEPGDVIRVESLPGDVGADIAFPEVLLRQTDAGLTVGEPLVSDAKVSGVIVSHEKEAKILVYKKRRRKNYRRLQGHRQNVTAVRVVAVD
ncbi:MAG: 50S ribosomal protein L21 [Candidatus Binatia bacterium]|nr:50S ribosomal protein L21 [Candidatus Binatia bacterium]